MHTSHRFLIAAVAVVSSACGEGTAMVTPTSASIASPVSVSISQQPPGQMAAFTGSGCMVGTGTLITSVTPIIPTTLFTPPFNVVVVASSNVNVTRLTVQMIDGTHLGPSISFPQAELTTQFGTVLIMAGTTRVFPVFPARSQGVCGATPWRTVLAELSVRDLQGTMHVVTATAPIF